MNTSKFYQLSVQLHEGEKIEWKNHTAKKRKEKPRQEKKDHNGIKEITITSWEQFVDFAEELKSL